MHVPISSSLYCCSTLAPVFTEVGRFQGTGISNFFFVCLFFYSNIKTKQKHRITCKSTELHGHLVRYRFVLKLFLLPSLWSVVFCSFRREECHCALKITRKRLKALCAFWHLCLLIFVAFKKHWIFWLLSCSLAQQWEQVEPAMICSIASKKSTQRRPLGLSNGLQK